MKHNLSNTQNVWEKSPALYSKVLSQFAIGKLPIALIFFMLLFSVTSRGQAYTNDFSFSGNLTSNGWIATGGVVTNPLATTTGLTYTGFPGSGVGNAVLMGNAGGEDDNVIYASQTSNVYYSCLVNVTEAGNKSGDYFLHLGGGGTGCTTGCTTFTSFCARLFAKTTASGVNFGISNSSTATYGPTNFTRNTTYLIIVKYVMVTGAGNDALTLWVLPSGVPATEAGAPAAELTNTGTAGIDNINALGLRQGSATASVQTVVDGIRIGTTWESVTGGVVATPTKLAITSISPASPTVNTVFSVTVQSQDAGGVPTNVTSNTTVNLSRTAGTGSLAGGTTSGVILSGSNSITITGVKYDVAESGVELTAADAGAVLTSGASTPFTVQAPAAALITLTGTLTAFSTSVGVPSTSQSYTVEGGALTDNITITPPANFEIKTGANAFATTPIVLTQSGGNVPQTTIDVRFNPIAAGASSGNITHTSTGATTKNEAVSGSALEFEPTTNGTLTFTLMGQNSAALSFPGGDGTSRLVVLKEASAVNFTPTDGAVPTGINSNFTTATDQGGTGNKVVFSGAGTTVSVTGLNPSTVYHGAVFQYNGTGSSANYLTPTTAIANATTLAPGSLPLKVPMASQPSFTYTENFADIDNWVNNFDNGLGAQYWSAAPSNATGAIPDGVKITTTSNAFTTGSTGGVQKGLTQAPGAIVLLTSGTGNNTNSVGIEIHLDYTGVNAGTLSYDWSIVNNSTGDRPASLRVYGSIDGTTYTEIPGTSVINKINNVAASGSIVAVQLPANFSNASNARIRFYEYNGETGGSAGSRPKFAIDNVVVTAGVAPTKLAITNINPASPVQNTPFSVTVQSQDNTNTPSIVSANTDITLSLDFGSGALGGTLTGTILAGTSQVIISGVTYNTVENDIILAAARTSGDALTSATSAPFSVVAPTPTLTVTGTLNPFQTAVGTQSTSQSYTVAGQFLTSDITITPPANFQVRTGANAFSSSPIIIPQAPAGTVSTTTIDVRYAPASPGPHSGNIVNSTAGTSAVNVAVSGTTSATEPTVASTATIGCITNSSIIVNFTGGNGASRIVVAREAVDVSYVPTDGIASTGVNSDFSLAADQGSGNKIVYDGSGNTVTVSGLSSTTQYYFVVYEYNGNGAITEYLQSSFGSNNAVTTGAASYSVTNGTYTQDFNGFPQTGTFSFTGTGAFDASACPVNALNANGWQFGKYGPLPLTGNAFFIVDNGNSTSGAAYSFGTTGSSDRAIGELVSSSLQPSVGIVLKNTTADVLRTVTISFTGEQWRTGGSGNPTTMHFSYSLNGTSISTGTYTAINALDFATPIANQVAGTPGPLNGNDPLNQTAVGPFTFNLNGNWAPGQLLVLHWEGTRGTGSGDGIAIDDFNFSATTPSAPLVQDHDISFSAVSTTSLTANWVNEDAANRIVKINTSNSFTNPVDFTGYPANSVYGGSGEQVVYNGSGSTVSVTNLSPGVTYWFRVYGYNGSDASSKYIISTATLNPNSQMTTPVSNATQLAILSVNGGVDPIVNQGFSVVVESQDNLGNPQVVVSNTLVTLSVASGVGGIGGTITGTILANQSQVTISGVTYNTADNNVQLQANGGGLNPGISAPFNVADVATLLNFGTVPGSGVVNSTVGSITVKAVRGDLTTDLNYTGAITISINTGPGGGIMSGTLTKNAVSGVATFNDISFSAAGTYTVHATASGLTATNSTDIIITANPSMTELVVPQFMGSKTSGSANSTRTPIAVCLRLDNLVPNTVYDIRGGLGLVSDAATSYGAGNIWSGVWGTANVLSAFTTDANGSSGPFWLYFQPTGNASRFGGGQVHNLRIGYGIHTGATNTPSSTPNFVGTKQITALDIQTTATVSTADDGAYLTGVASQCVSGKYILVYNNTAGTGDPMFVYQARQATPTDNVTGNYSGLPAPIKDVYMQNGTSVIGQWPAVIPIGANNPNGVRRIEARNADNTIFNAETDADGVWPGGANTVTNVRVSVTTLSNSDAPLSTYIQSVAPLTGCPGSSVVITGKYLTGTSNVSFNGTSASFVVNSDAQITATVPAGATTGNISLTNACAVTGPSFTVTSCGITLTSNIFIQGFYSGGGLMQTGGAGCLNMVGASPDPTDADTITISIMEAASPYNEVESVKGVVKTNGAISVSLTNAVAGNSYWIKLSHRNSVETWSAAPIVFSASTTYLFSTSASQAYLSNQADMGDGNFAIFNGDITREGTVDGSDFLDLDPAIQNGDGGYVTGDLNGDGTVDGSDFLLLDPNIQNGVGAAVPNP
jgi:hypothetical protein